jgi:protease secretion system membrane fusion protein
VPPSGAPDSPPAAPTAAPTPSRRAAWTRRLLALAVAAGVAWIALAPLDEGVPAAGLVVVDTKRKPVQHHGGGIVQQVMVREGDRVTAGQVLFRLDPAVPDANREASRQRYWALRAAQARLAAERDGLPRIDWHPDLVRAAADPEAARHMASQSALLASRRQAHEAEQRALAESLEAQRSAERTATAMLGNAAQRLRLLREELVASRPLAAEGYLPRNRVLELERLETDAQSQIADLEGQRERARRAVGEIEQRRVQRAGEYRKEIHEQLADVLRDVEAEGQRLHAAEKESARTGIVSPIDGLVVGLAVQSPGSVIQPAQKLLDVVPFDEKLMIDVQVPPHLADRVRVGQGVDVRFAAFSHTPQLLVHGKVAGFSADLLVDPQTQASYYLARVALGDDAQQVLGERRLQPGMPADVVFVTGERSLLTYWLHPLVKRLAHAMKEE